MEEQGREWDFTVHKELMFREVAEPEMGETMEARARVCVPFPFQVDVPNNDASRDFEVHVQGWKNFAYYSPGAPPPLGFHETFTPERAWHDLTTFLSPRHVWSMQGKHDLR